MRRVGRTERPRRDLTPLWLGVALGLVLGGSACGADTTTALGSNEDCFNGKDDDGDGDIDCADRDCQGHLACDPFREYNCDNGVDDDEDQKVDCADPDCADQQACNPDREVACGDGEDNDGDTLVDCYDPDCQPKAACQETCEDQVDNDLDGLVDCLDPDCATHPHCSASVEVICDDGVDNDSDGMIDCQDTDCEGVEGCRDTPPPEICDDGVDNDGDGKVDCADPDCQGNGQCVEYACTDGIDNDGDGKVDCRDADCQGPNTCQPDPTCQGATPIQCGDSFTDFTMGLPNTWSSYPCQTSVQLLGGERIYQLTGTAADSHQVVVSLQGNDGTTQFALIAFHGSNGQCDPTNSCEVAYHSAGDDPELALSTSLGTEQFLVVDTVQSAGGAFSMSVYCSSNTQEVCNNDADDDGDLLEDCWDPDCQYEGVCDWWISGGVVCDTQNPGATCAPGEYCSAVTVNGTLRNQGICTRDCLMGTPSQCHNPDYPFGECVVMPLNGQACVQQCGTGITDWEANDCPPNTQCTNLTNGTVNPVAGVCAPIY